MDLVDKNWTELQNTAWAFLWAALAGGTITATLVVIKSRSWKPLFPIQRLPWIGWTGREVILAFLIYLVSFPLVQWALEKKGFYEGLYEKLPSFARQTLWSTLLAAPVVLVCILALFSSLGVRPANLGLSRARWLANLLLGFLGFLVLSPLCLGIFFLVNLWLPSIPHKLTLLGKEPLLPIEWVLVFFQAVVAAPILEELLFRGILQGWLRRLTAHGAISFVLIIVVLSGVQPVLEDKKAREIQVKEKAALITSTVGLAGSPAGPYQAAAAAYPGRITPVPGYGWGPGIFGTLLILGLGLGLYGIARRFPNDLLSPDTAWKGQKAQAYLAIFASASLFAVFHSAAWPTPIPLFVMGLGQGWLTYRTNSLIGPIYLHALFNTVAFLMLIWG